MILENICTNPDILTVFLILKYAFHIVCIIVPIILMVKLISILTPVIISGEKLNESVSKMVKSAISAIVVFMLPSIINFVFTDIIDILTVKTMLSRRKELCQEKVKIFISVRISDGKDAISHHTTPQGERSISPCTGKVIQKSN